MTESSQPSRKNKPSIKYKCSSLGESFELLDINDEDFSPSKQNGQKSEAKSSEILSTADLVLAVGQVWHFASRPLTFLQPKKNSRHNDGDPEEKVFYYYHGEGNGRSSTSAESQYFPVNLITTGYSSPMVHTNIEFLKVSKKISFFELHTRYYTHSLFWRFVQHRSNILNESWKEKTPATVGCDVYKGSTPRVSYDWRNIYGWMNEISFPGLKHLVNTTLIKNMKIGESCLINNPCIGSVDYHSEIVKCLKLSSGQRTRAALNPSITSLCSDYYLEALKVTETNGSVLGTPISRLHADYNIQYLAPDSHAYEECQHRNDDGHLNENKMHQNSEFVAEDNSKTEMFLPANNKPPYGLARQEHACSGALAGIFVSLCLHPVDTVKTVIQSCRADQRSINYIGRSIVSERGVTGLYRGIASNIASSAPISAVYTFTYESVKGALSPFLSREYQSFAHCMGGGCASIATSFIFTPSERIKQQMQLICGGLAGSTAALFTTPFDVVKTRLQTQIPGSFHRYNGVVSTLVEIGKHEGLKGLYRGLIPRLVMYISQGAIFFASYESFKRLFSLEVSQIYAQASTRVPNIEDEVL
ncbi:hypothetical protein U1Q18_019623 [Sarracenia purpurea var. burkii]